MKTEKTIKAILETGATSEFWKIICEDLDKDILGLQREIDNDEIASMPAIEYKLAMENLKDKIKHLKNLKNKPQMIIQNLDNVEEEADDESDPYPR